MCLCPPMLWGPCYWSAHTALTYSPSTVLIYTAVLCTLTPGSSPILTVRCQFKPVWCIILSGPIWAFDLITDPILEHNCLHATRFSCSSPNPPALLSSWTYPCSALLHQLPSCLTSILKHQEPTINLLFSLYLMLKKLGGHTCWTCL